MRLLFVALMLSVSFSAQAGKKLPIPYPFATTNIAKWDSLQRDENGIPLTNFNGQWALNPTNIAQVATVYYCHYYYNQAESSRKEFLKLAYWLMDNVSYDSGFAVWTCPVAFSNYRLEPNWPSAMAQGFILSVLLEAEALTKDKSFGDLADDALIAFEKSIENGGIRSSWPPVSFYEEYAGDPPAHVLNGFLFSLAGLYDHHRITGSKKSRQLLDEGFNWLQFHLPAYDAGFTSYYSQIQPGGQFANAIGDWPFDHYHELHILQLLWAYEITGHEIFYRYAHKFLQYDMNAFTYMDQAKLKEMRSNTCIDCDNYGPDRLSDGYWSYEKYWSCKGENCAVTIVPDQPISAPNRIVLFAYERENKAASVRIAYWKEGVFNPVDSLRWLPVRSEQEINTGKHITTVQLVDIPYPIQSADSLQIEFLPKSESGLVAFREIDLHFFRLPLLEELRAKYRYHLLTEPRPAPQFFPSFMN
jgi:hypothetical protein